MARIRRSGPSTPKVSSFKRRSSAAIPKVKKVVIRTRVSGS